jgi:hypothetical protein
MKTTRQPNLFQQAEDLPLFSGTAQTVRLETFHPQPQQQPGLFTAVCPICYGTGLVTTRKNHTVKCSCRLSQF